MLQNASFYIYLPDDDEIYELRYREVGGDTIQIGNVNSWQANSINGLRNDKTYEVSIAAINRGGKGPYSNWASVTMALASG